MDAEPLLGLEETVKTVPSVRPSASVAARVPVIAVASSLPEPVVPEETTAESSTAVIVSAMACVVVPPQSSVTVTVKESLPLVWALGV
jgi:hypothetical protein